MANQYEVAAYYFPQWHPDPQNEEKRGKGWSEWVSMRAAQPRFTGHEQPKVPLWGELDESDPRVSEKQIAAAADHGITVFLYDWYWDMGSRGNGPYLQRALEEGYLKAGNKDRLKFALMWANHNQLSRERFEVMIDYIIETYLGSTNYWTVNGELYFSIYEMHTLIKGLGGIEETRAALDSFRNKVAEAGLPRLHLNAMEWGLQSQHQDIIGDNPNRLANYLGVNSVTSYVWAHNLLMEHFPAESFTISAAAAPKLWETLQDRFDAPYYPNVTMGWDPSPRTDQGMEYAPGEYPYTAILTENTPAEFEKSLQDAKSFLDRSSLNPKVVTLYAWNEWTEGGYLEPDTVHGLGYLEAIQRVFGKQD